MPNCSSCSAPLPAKSIICDYCGVRNDIDITPPKKKKVVPHIKSDRFCPDCTIPLETIDVGKGASFMLEKCPECYGLFFDNNELEHLIEESVKPSFFIDHHKVNSLLQNPRHKDKIVYRHCPVCDQLMHRENYMDHSGIIMDVCHFDGIWLDAGEFKQIQEWMALGGHNNTNRQEMEKRHIREARKERKRFQNNRQAHTETYRSKKTLPDPYFGFLSDFF